MPNFSENLDTDFANMLDTSAFAKSVNYQAQGGGESYDIDAIFEAKHQHIDTRTQANTTSPIVFFKRDVLPGEIRRGDTVTVDGTAFKVSSQQPDGMGGVLVFLTKDDD